MQEGRGGSKGGREGWYVFRSRMPACITCWQKIEGLYRVCSSFHRSGEVGSRSTLAYFGVATLESTPPPVLQFLYRQRTDLQVGVNTDTIATKLFVPYDMPSRYSSLYMA